MFREFSITYSVETSYLFASDIIMVCSIINVLEELKCTSLGIVN